MNKNEVITLQFGNYSNFIGAHWWNIQDSSFVYNTDTVPEIDYDVLYREGENLKKEVTYTPRLLLVDLKGSTGGLPLLSDLYEEVCIPEVNEDNVLWPPDKVEVEHESEYEKNEFLSDLEEHDNKMNTEQSHHPEELTKQLTHRYELDDKVKYWSDYLAVKFHPRTFTIIHDYQHDPSENTFKTYPQGVALWKTGLFTERWSDSCRAYAEECDYLQGFQVLFDCTDGFSGLCCSALTHLQDEFSSKSVLTFPSIMSSYANDKSDKCCLRLLNTVISLSELPELSSAFVPLCTDIDGGLGSENPRHFDNLSYNNRLAYNNSALLASYLDTVSLSYRLRKNSTHMSSFLSKLNPCGRKLLSATLRLPFPIYAGLSVLESLEKLSEPFWTSLTPKTNVTLESAPLQEMTVRGLSSFALFKSLEKRSTNEAYACKSVTELLSMFLEYSSNASQKGRFSIRSFDTPLKIPKSYPNIFCDEVTRIGCVATEPMPIKIAIVETPALAGLHNCSSASMYLSDLCEKASKVNTNAVHSFSSIGFEKLEYSESLEKLLTLNDNYI